MKLVELRKATRTRLQDVTKPYLWLDSELDAFINEAEREVAERGQLIFDADTPEVCHIPVRAGQRTYPLHRSILKLRRAKLDGGNRPLVETSVQQMDEGVAGCSNWDTQTGLPLHFIPNGSTSITLVRIPVADDVLRLQVTRLPLCAMAKDDDQPEIPERYHFRMLDWAVRCAYLKQDNETMDKDKAAEFEANFTASFGVRPDANVQRKQREGPRTVRMGTW